MSTPPGALIRGGRGRLSETFFLNNLLLCTAMLYLIALMLSCSTGANNLIPYTSLRRIPFVPRGGCSSNTADSPTVDRLLIGVLDLRPTPDPDSIIVLKGIAGNSSDAFEVVQQARFPGPKYDGKSDIENELDQQAASSHCIGNLCSTVYLAIEYDFDNGKTVLHRSLGGAKLMAFVDGARCRWHGLSQTNKTDEGDATKLIILLVPSSTSRIKFLTALNHKASLNTCNPRLKTISLNLEATGDTDWDASGVAFLVGRLSEAFALGGQEFQKVEPFAIQFGILDVGEEEEEAELSEIIARCIWRTRTSPPSVVCCSSEISDAFQNAGGVGNVNYQWPK